MTETKNAGRPRRDANGRLATIGDLLGVVLAGLLCGAVVLLIFEAATALFRLSRFGDTSGWLILVLPAWLFFDDFRAASFGAQRVLVALLAAGFAFATGMTAAGLADGLPPLVGGGVGATAATVTYAAIWFYGMRWTREGTRP